MAKPRAKSVSKSSLSTVAKSKAAQTSAKGSKSVSKATLKAQAKASTVAKAPKGSRSKTPAKNSAKKPAPTPQPTQTKAKGKRGKRSDSQEKDLATAAGSTNVPQKKGKLDLSKLDIKVDEHCHAGSYTHVYVKNDKIYDAKLNQSNVKHNNNKYYIIQMLQHNSNPSTFYVFNRWGRVGVPGQTALKGPFGEDGAMKEYEKKLHEKSVRGDYRVLEMSYEKEGAQAPPPKALKTSKGSKLPPQVQNLISLIYDLTMMNKQMKDIGYDTAKMPLGKLSVANIQKGFAVLKELSDAIKNKKNYSIMQDLSSDFYSLIPHDFGFQKMANFVINTDQKVKEKLELLESLRDIQIAHKLLDQKSEDESIIDSNYKKLKCKINPVQSNSKEYKMIADYINNTKESGRLEIMDMFEIEREGEEKRFTKNLHNHLLLWHGSRLTNFVGIISQGLRIAPPEAPSSGYRFGKGIYLADMISKSVGYCYSYCSDNIFCILVCEAALGTPNELMHDDFNASKLPKGKHSTKALGHVAPPESSYKPFDKSTMIPTGKAEKTKHQNSSCYNNEFIVYDVNQVKLRYLIKMKEK